ncbi:MAG: GntR family transcriptional regulator [Lachnospiraceae bacterium]|nr:GntR family transcriptional regulator [Lachnospiraceae bacterium]
MKWEFKNGVPIYQQIMQILHIRIANGTYPPGSKIPAVRELAMEAGVNPNTMQRALAELERDGLLAAWRTSGRYVTEDEQKLSQLREELAAGFARELCENLRELGMQDQEIIGIVSRELET